MDSSNETSKDSLPQNEDSTTTINSDMLIPTILESLIASSPNNLVSCHHPGGQEFEEIINPSVCTLPAAVADFRSDFSSELAMDMGAVQMIDDLKSSESLTATLSSSAPTSVLVAAGDESTLGSTFSQVQAKLGALEDDSRSSFGSFKAPMAPLDNLPLEEDSQSSMKAPTPSRSDTLVPEEDSQSSFTSQRSAKRRLEVVDLDERNIHSLPAEKLFEYQWPPGGSGDYYILQEQISEYLGVKSFKRKYPDLQRRQVEMDEKEFLKERGVVSETQCDLGLTALRSDEVIDLMVRDYFHKYQEYERLLHEKEKQSINAKHRGYVTPTIEKSKMADFIRKSSHSAANWNMQLNHERKEERRACFDLQTNIVHYPTGRSYKVDKEATKVGLYPVALLPGQFQDHYKRYTPNELRYLPLNTVLYGPRLRTFVETVSDVSPSDSDDSSSSDGSSSGSTRDGSCDSSTGDTTSGSQVQQLSVQTSSSSVSQPPPPSALPSFPLPPLPHPPVLVSVNPRPIAKEKKGPMKNGRPRKKREPIRGKIIIKDIVKLTSGQCHVCSQSIERLVDNKLEEIIKCSLCGKCAHASCLELGPEVVSVIRSYAWQCMDCKTCALCLDPHDEAKMMFCEKCDRGYHTFCVGIKNLPRGPWVCISCGKCGMCGTERPAAEGSKIQWHHEYAKTSSGKKELKQTLCLVCAKLNYRIAAKNKVSMRSDIIEGDTTSPRPPIRLQVRMKKTK